MSEGKAYYVPMAIQKWESATVNEAGKQKPLKNSTGKSIGFLQAYESLEDLKKEHGDDQDYATFFGVTT